VSREAAAVRNEFHQPADDNMSDFGARVALMERSILVLLFVGLFIGGLAIVKPFTTAILFGVALSTAAWPLRNRELVCRGLSHGATATLLLLCSLVLVVLPMLVVAPHFTDQMVQATQRVQDYFAGTDLPSISSERRKPRISQTWKSPECLPAGSRELPEPRS
jgi:predicted PurR-regulated permease PerM